MRIRSQIFSPGHTAKLDGADNIRPMSFRSLTLSRWISTLTPFIFMGLFPSLHAQTHVEVISTSMGHVSVVQVPDQVENVAVGSAQVHVEWHDKNILIQPEKPGIDTNMVVFTNRTTYLYEISAAATTADMSWLVKEYAPPPPPPPAAPDPVVVFHRRDEISTGIMMNMRSIDSTQYRHSERKSKTVVITVDEMSEDASNFYVKLSATNKSKHVYRLQNPSVFQIDPAFGADVAYKSVYHQLSEKGFQQFKAYKQTTLMAHGSTLKDTDMPPDSTMDWVVSITKPSVTPALVQFIFPNDQRTPIDAVAIF